MTNPFKSLILCVLTYITLATPITLHVSQHDVPKVSPQEQHSIIQEYICIKTALYHETRGEPTEGIRAVLSVIQNRKNHKDYPSTFCGVIKQPYQFSYYNSIKHDRTVYKALEAKVKATIASLAFEAAVGSFNGILDSSVVMYHAKNMKVYPAWSRKYRKYAIIHSHVFYKG